MSYMHIDNLYKDQRILEFSYVFAMEKIHGTSAHLSWQEEKLTFFSGGCKHAEFVKLFDIPALEVTFQSLSLPTVAVYGEAYGGKLQGMKNTYGDKLRFVAFEVRIGDSWLSVPDANNFTDSLKLEFVHWKKIPATIEAIDAERDANSVQAVRNGCGEGKMREGIVLRPPFEVFTNGGHRIIAKHKRDEFKETRTRRPVNTDKLAILTEANAIADEWVTEMRLAHILDGMQEISIERTSEIIKLMVSDVEREGFGEVELSKDACRAIGAKTARMFKERLKISG